MGYDLSFWAYADETLPRTPDDHLTTYNLLCDGAVPDDLAALPAGEIRSRLPGVLGGWTAEGGSFERPGAAIAVTIEPVWVRFDLYGKWTGGEADALIDLMKTFGCPLFDPQSPPKGERFSHG